MCDAFVMHDLLEGAMFGKNLKYYRLRKGMTKTSLAKACGVTPTAITNYENGMMPERMDVVKRLASALDVKVIDFLSQWDDGLKIEFAEFRKQTKCNVSGQEYVRSAVEEYLNRFYAVIDVLGEMVLPVPPEMHVISMSNDIEKNAIRLRKHLGFSPVGPIGRLIELLENIGIIVFTIEYSNGAAFSGMNGVVNGRPYIVLNKNMKPGAMRATIAHELAHIFFDWSGYDGNVEKTAMAIGGSFLLPADDLFRELGSKRNAVTNDMLMSCAEFGVSFMLLVMRAQVCGIISTASARSFFIHANKNGWRKNDPANVEAERPTLLNQLVYRAVTQEEISYQKGAEILKCSVAKIASHCAMPSDGAV